MPCNTALPISITIHHTAWLPPWYGWSRRKQFRNSVSTSNRLILRHAIEESVAPIHKFLGGGGKIFYGIVEILFGAVMPKAPFQHPLLKSIHVLKCTKAWYACVHMGPSIKYVTLQGGRGLRKCDSLWQGEGEGKDCVTSHFKFFHNS